MGDDDNLEPAWASKPTDLHAACRAALEDAEAQRETNFKAHGDAVEKVLALRARLDTAEVRIRDIVTAEKMGAEHANECQDSPCDTCWVLATVHEESMKLARAFLADGPNTEGT